MRKITQRTGTGPVRKTPAAGRNTLGDKTPFDGAAHSVLAELLDEIEHLIVSNGDCTPLSANDMLCRFYIVDVASVLFGAQWHTYGDERTGISIFLHKLHGGKRLLRSSRMSYRCVSQMLNYTISYFPNYVSVLTVLYVDELDKLKTQNQLMISGMMKLAAKDIRGARSDIRRKLRSLSGGFDYMIVDDDTMDRALARLTGSFLQKPIDKSSKEGD